jgi:hypothetical protein
VKLTIDLSFPLTLKVRGHLFVELVNNFEMSNYMAGAPTVY